MPPTSSAPGRSPRPVFNSSLALIAAIVVLVAAVGILEPRFFNRLNLLNVARNASLLSLVGLGQALVIVSGGFDLSIGAVIALSSVISASTMVAFMAEHSVAMALGLGMAAGIATGIAVGFVNGLTIVGLKVSPFMVTLGMASVVTGGALVLTNGVPIYGLPDILVDVVGRGRVAGVPTMALGALALTVLLVLLQKNTLYGRHLHAVGSDREAAELSGVPARRSLVITYMISAVLAAVVGILMTARVGSGQANIGVEFTLQSVAVAVVGGVSLRGGIGRLENVALSAVLITLVANAMNIIKIESKLQTVVLGLGLIAAVAAENYTRRRQRIG